MRPNGNTWPFHHGMPSSSATIACCYTAMLCPTSRALALSPISELACRSIRLGIFVPRNRLAWSVRDCTSVSPADQTTENVPDMSPDSRIMDRVDWATWTYEGKSWGYGRLASTPSSYGSAGR
jgi:hypothetical protein